MRNVTKHYSKEDFLAIEVIYHTLMNDPRFVYENQEEIKDLVEHIADAYEEDLNNL